MYRHTLLPLLLLMVLLSACNKGGPDNPPVVSDPGDFSATVNGTAWNPPHHTATYFPSEKILYIQASVGNDEFTAGINIDSAAPLKQYGLQANGDNAVRLIYDATTYDTDHNMLDAGGTFTLTKIDTLTKKLSGQFQLKAYSTDRSKTVVLAQNTITDIPLAVDTAASDSSYAKCTVIGARTTTWQTTNVTGRIWCMNTSPTGLKKTLELQIASLLGGYANHRYILLSIPLEYTTGTYTILPHLPPEVYCMNRNFTGNYTVNDYDNSYFPTSASITITHIDTTAKRMRGLFSLDVKDRSARGETIRITNGEFVLNRWRQ